MKIILMPSLFVLWTVEMTLFKVLSRSEFMMAITKVLGHAISKAHTVCGEALELGATWSQGFIIHRKAQWLPQMTP